MSYKTVCICVVVALALGMASAQTKTTMTGKCSKPTVQQSLSVPEQQGHSFTISQGNCTAMGDVKGVAGKSGVYTEHGDMMGNHLKNGGVYVETLDSGDNIFYEYQGTAMTNNGAITSGTNTYRIAGGTGKMKGIKGSGNCKLTGNSDGSLDYSCNSTYTLAGSGMSKK